MNINRNNYEEYFLLYVDNELSPQQRHAVEVFCEQNPDLEEELRCLQQCVLTPDETSFTAKDDLLKKDLLPAELQQQLLLLLDNELDNAAGQQLLARIATDETLQKEWQLLQQTKLSFSDTVIFNDKAILYKKEPTRVFAVNWWRMTAAAVVIGFGIWLAFNFNSKPTTNTNDLVKTAPARAVKKEIPSNKPATPVTNKNESVAQVTTAQMANEQINKKSKEQSVVKNTILPSVKVPVQQQVVAIKVKQDNQLPTPYFEKNNGTVSNKNDVAIVAPAEDNRIDENTTNEINVKAANTIIDEPGIQENSYAVLASFNNNEPAEEDETRNPKGKLGGFLKKVKRMVERKTNLRSGNNDIKIANLSFAVQ